MRHIQWGRGGCKDRWGGEKKPQSLITSFFDSVENVTVSYYLQVGNPNETIAAGKNSDCFASKMGFAGVLRALLKTFLLLFSR